MISITLKLFIFALHTMWKIRFFFFAAVSWVANGNKNWRATILPVQYLVLHPSVVKNIKLLQRDWLIRLLGNKVAGEHDTRKHFFLFIDWFTEFYSSFYFPRENFQRLQQDLAEMIVSSLEQRGHLKGSYRRTLSTRSHQKETNSQPEYFHLAVTENPITSL